MNNTVSQKIPLKDQLFTGAKVQQVATQIQSIHSSFDVEGFVNAVMAKFPELELKARITWMAECLHEYLPPAYARAVKILVSSLPPPVHPHKSDNDFGDFIYAPHSEFIARYGCTEAHLQRSLDALYEITQRFSVEFSIRPFLNAFPTETLEQLAQWVHDQHYHVRRLCSEGTRPKLPWGEKLSIPIEAPLPLLDVLIADKTRFVTRSVANHLNDLTKIDPDLAMDTIEQWKHTAAQTPKEMEYIVRHALRSLIKQGNERALSLLGFVHNANVSVTEFTVPSVVPMNTDLVFSAILTADTDTDVLIDYILHFQNKAGKLNNKKVYKLTRLSLAADIPTTISKKHPLRAGMTTRPLYPGAHKIEIQINGTTRAAASFLLQ